MALGFEHWLEIEENVPVTSTLTEEDILRAFFTNK